MLEYFWRIAIAALLAGAIGLERELRLKEAGLKAYLLVYIYKKETFLLNANQILESSLKFNSDRLS